MELAITDYSNIEREEKRRKKVSEIPQAQLKIQELPCQSHNTGKASIAENL